MKTSPLVYVGIVIAILLAVGAYFPIAVEPEGFGAGSGKGSRYPNGLSANTNLPTVGQGQLRGTNLKLDTTNTATSSAAVGCIQTTATSTATPLRFVISSTPSASTTFQGGTSNFTVLAQYGTCPA